MNYISDMYNIVNKVKNQSRFYNIDCSFLNLLHTKYTDKISASEYIIERLRYKNIDRIFSTDNSYISTFSKNTKNFDNFNIIKNPYDLGAYYCAKSYADATNGVGVLMNTTESTFEDYSEILCCVQPLLSICLFADNKDLTDATANTISIHNCFKDAQTIKDINKLPVIFEYMLTLAEENPTGPTHINISLEMCDNYIDLREVVFIDY